MVFSPNADLLQFLKVVIFDKLFPVISPDLLSSFLSVKIKIFYHIHLVSVLLSKPNRKIPVQIQQKIYTNNIRGLSLVISSVFIGVVVNVVSTRKRNFVLAHYQSIEKFQSDHQKDSEDKKISLVSIILTVNKFIVFIATLNIFFLSCESCSWNNR